MRVYNGSPKSLGGTYVAGTAVDDAFYLEARAEGSTLTVTLNGTETFSRSDPYLSGGTVGFMMSTTSTRHQLGMSTATSGPSALY